MDDGEGQASGGGMLSRRRFVVRAMGVIGAAVAAALAIPIAGFASASGWRSSLPRPLLSQPVVPTLRSSEWTSVGHLADFEVGVPSYVTVERHVVDGWVEEIAPIGVQVVREGDAAATVFDPHCTHLGCPLSWSTGSRAFVCPCHGGTFDTTGAVVSGPPPRPMIRYETRIENGEVLIGSLQEGA